MLAKHMKAWFWLVHTQFAKRTPAPASVWLYNRHPNEFYDSTFAESSYKLYTFILNKVSD